MWFSCCSWCIKVHENSRSVSEVVCRTSYSYQDLVYSASARRSEAAAPKKPETRNLPSQMHSEVRRRVKAVVRAFLCSRRGILTLLICVISKSAPASHFKNSRDLKRRSLNCCSPFPALAALCKQWNNKIHLLLTARWWMISSFACMVSNFQHVRLFSNSLSYLQLVLVDLKVM